MRSRNSHDGLGDDIGWDIIACKFSFLDSRAVGELERWQRLSKTRNRRV